MPYLSYYCLTMNSKAIKNSENPRRGRNIGAYAALKRKNYIRQLMLRKGLSSFAELAKKIGVTKQTLNDVLGPRERRALSTETAIAEAIGEPVETLFYERFES